MLFNSLEFLAFFSVIFSLAELISHRSKTVCYYLRGFRKNVTYGILRSGPAIRWSIFVLMYFLILVWGNLGGEDSFASNFCFPSDLNR